MRENYNYYERINSFIDRNKKIISILSPTFSIYNYSKKIGDKEYNKVLADNTKKFFAALSLYIILFISIFSFKQFWIKDEVNLILKVVYLIICIISPYIIINNIIFKKYGIAISYNGKNKYEKIRANTSKFVFSKNIPIIFNIILFIYAFIIFNTNIYKYNIIKILLFLITIYIFGVSRPIQFFLVFTRDMIKKTYVKDERDVDGKIRLIILAIISLINLILDYTILFYALHTIGSELLNTKMFECTIENIVDMLYYTSGFGDIEPKNFITKILVMMKDIAIFILVTGNLTMYLSIESESKISST